jgi:hypothetical protein
LLGALEVADQSIHEGVPEAEEGGVSAAQCKIAIEGSLTEIRTTPGPADRLASLSGQVHAAPVVAFMSLKDVIRSWAVESFSVALLWGLLVAIPGRKDTPGH